MPLGDGNLFKVMDTADVLLLCREERFFWRVCKGR